MRFPILKYLVLKTEPVTAYELERTKFDIVRDGKNTKGWIDKPTIYDTLKLMEEYKDVELTERKECLGGRVRKKYIVTRRGVAEVLSFSYREHIDISNRYVRELAEKQKSSFPLIFDLWPEFVREGAEDLACQKLIRACHLAVVSDIEESFFGLIVNDLKGGEDHPGIGVRVSESDRKTWLEVVSRNDKIRKVLVDLIMRQVSEHMGEANEALQLLWAPELKLSPTDEAEMTDRIQQLEKEAGETYAFIERIEKKLEAALTKLAPEPEQS